MSWVPMGSSIGDANPFGPRFLERYDGAFPDQGVGAEMIAERWGLSRTQFDEFALVSHERAAAAQDDGRFAGQLAPVTLPGRHRGRHRRGRPPRWHGREARGA